MKALVLSLTVLISIAARAQETPFDQFIGTYEVVSSLCEVDGQAERNGCELVEIKILADQGAIKIYEEDSSNYSIHPLAALKTESKTFITYATFTGDDRSARWTKIQESFEKPFHVVREVRYIYHLRNGDYFYEVVRDRKSEGKVVKHSSKAYRLKLKVL